MQIVVHKAATVGRDNVPSSCLNPAPAPGKSAAIMKNCPLPRLDNGSETRGQLLPYCRLKPGEIWRDPLGRHGVGCLDAADLNAVCELLQDASARAGNSRSAL